MQPDFFYECFKFIKSLRAHNFPLAFLCLIQNNEVCLTYKIAKNKILTVSNQDLLFVQFVLIYISSLFSLLLLSGFPEQLP